MSTTKTKTDATKTIKKPAAVKESKSTKPAKDVATKPAPEASSETPTSDKAKTSKKPPKAKTERKLSAIDAAAQVLAATKEPMNAKQMIEAMAAQKLWTSPGGQTPHATLYSAILREIGAKGDAARFKKADRGLFAANVKA